MLGIALTSSLALVACGQQEGGASEEVSNTSKVDQKDSSIKLIPNFMVVGEKNIGYIQVPEEFVSFYDGELAQNGVISKVIQYAKIDQSFILSAMSLNSDATLGEGIAGITSSMEADGPVESKKVKIDGYEAAEIYQYYADVDYHLYVYLVDTGDDLKFISLEFTGSEAKEKEELKEQIISTYSADEPNFED